ncbi:MAG TPA: NUDIX domain-containing protein [Pyrinomonadaceae bacterium]|nr:NUDIX domain-containing protein [Pyrinomonadaceae bacterium]
MGKGKEKAVPIVLRERDGRKHILVFRHPTEGVQMVKGNIDDGESASEAAERELREESGLDDVVGIDSCGEWKSEEDGDLWHLFICRLSSDPPDEWDHFTHDGGGLTFSFFWHDLEEAPGVDWEDAFAEALPKIRALCPTE